MVFKKIFKGCCTADAVQVVPSIAHQQGEARTSDGEKAQVHGRLADNLDTVTALATDERLAGAMHGAPRYGGAGNTDGESISLADSIMDRFEDDIQWHKHRGGALLTNDRRPSHLQLQQAAAMQPPQSQPLKDRIATYPETSSEGSATTDAEHAPLTSPVPSPPNLKLMADPGQHISPTNWGFPGYLSSAEYDVYLQFRSEIAKRPPIFRDTIYCFGFEEEEPYALCRWLRARKFDYDKVVQMVEQAIECSADAARNSFYPDPTDALGVEPSVYFSLYPELFCGYSKQGCPLYITRAGECDIRKIMSVTTEAKIINFHWHCMRIAFGGRLAKKRRTDPNVHRFEGFVIFDMEGLSIPGCMDALNVFKAQSSIDQLCFPESLNRFIVINAPAAFSMVWRIVKTLVDARTAAKVEIYASRRPIWEKRLLELVDPQDLPSDYGGKAPTTMDVFQKQTTDQGLARQFTVPITAKHTEETHEVKLGEDESLELSIFTKSTKMGHFSICQVDQDEKSEAIVSELQTLDVKHRGEGHKMEDEEPTIVKFPKLIKGPGQFSIKASCKEGKEVFVLVGRITDRENQGAVKRSPTKALKCTEISVVHAPTDDSSVTTESPKKPVRLPDTRKPVVVKQRVSERPSIAKLAPPIRYTTTLAVKPSPNARAVYVTMGIAVFVMLHDFWLLWALTAGGECCECEDDEKAVTILSSRF